MNNSFQETNRSPGSPSCEDWWNPEAGHELLILEDQTVRAVFDAKTGARIDFQHKPTGWKIQSSVVAPATIVLLTMNRGMSRSTPL